MRPRLAARLACLAAASSMAATVHAQQDFPNKPIRIIVGYAAGGGNDIIVRVVKLPEIKERLDQMAIVPSGNTPEEFRGIIARDIARWTAVAKAANIKAD